jgi:hypothetical protein
MIVWWSRDRLAVTFGAIFPELSPGQYEAEILLPRLGLNIVTFVKELAQ